MTNEELQDLEAFKELEKFKELLNLLDQIPQYFDHPFIILPEEVDAAITEYGLKNLHTGYCLQSDIVDLESLWYKDTVIAILGNSAASWFHARRHIAELEKRQLANDNLSEEY